MKKYDKGVGITKKNRFNNINFWQQIESHKSIRLCCGSKFCFEGIENDESGFMRCLSYLIICPHNQL
jgi:hypothetical protein